jgi:hypothetical protein
MMNNAKRQLISANVGGSRLSENFAADSIGIAGYGSDHTRSDSA